MSTRTIVCMNTITIIYRGTLCGLSDSSFYQDITSRSTPQYKCGHYWDQNKCPDNQGVHISYQGLLKTWSNAILVPLSLSIHNYIHLVYRVKTLPPY